MNASTVTQEAVVDPRDGVALSAGFRGFIDRKVVSAVNASLSSMETYIQTEYSGSCLGCHKAATTADGRPADFTFALGQLAREGQRAPSR